MFNGRHHRAPEMPFLYAFLLVMSLTYLTYKANEYLRHKGRDDNINRVKISGQSVEYHMDSVEDYQKKMAIVISELQQDGTILRQTVKEFFSPTYLLMKQDLELCEMEKEKMQVEYKALKTKLEKTEAELSSYKKPG